MKRRSYTPHKNAGKIKFSFQTGTFKWIYCSRMLYFSINLTDSEVGSGACSEASAESSRNIYNYFGPTLVWNKNFLIGLSSWFQHKNWFEKKMNWIIIYKWKCVKNQVVKIKPVYFFIFWVKSLGCTFFNTDFCI